MAAQFFNRIGQMGLGTPALKYTYIHCSPCKNKNNQQKRAPRGNEMESERSLDQIATTANWGERMAPNET